MPTEVWVALVAAVPATIAAVAAWRSSKRSGHVAEEVRDEVSVPQAPGAPATIGEAVASIYERLGIIEGIARGHAADDARHVKKGRR